MKRILMLRGLPASGKTTWAKSTIKDFPGQYKRVNKDELRLMLDDGHYTKHNEQFILNLRDHIIEEALLDGKSVIVDDTNFHPKHEQAMKTIIQNMKQLGHDVALSFVDFSIPIEEAIERDLKRQNSVGEAVIRNMYEKYIKNQAYKIPYYIEQDESLDHCVIVDLDGTLAISDGRDPYDASTCETDLVNEPVLSMLDMIDSELKIIILSGRSDAYKNQTIGWLNGKMIPYDELHMRKAGDMRKDSIVKKEMYDAFVKDKYFVEFVLDDRNQVVDMWREIGLPCFQVYYGDF